MFKMDRKLRLWMKWGAVSTKPHATGTTAGGDDGSVMGGTIPPAALLDAEGSQASTGSKGPTRPLLNVSAAPPIGFEYRSPRRASVQRAVWGGDWPMRGRENPK